MANGARTGVGAVALAFLLVACSGKRVHEEPIMENGDRVSVEEPEEEAAAGADRGEELRARRDSIAAEALATCEGDLCAALARGEVSVGMTLAHVLAASGSTEESWRVRRSGPATVLLPRSPADPPADGIAPLAIVQLRGGRVVSFGYREPEGVRLVRSPEDATADARAAARAERLVGEGDELAARGRFEAALDRYDRADVIRPGDPLVAYKIATALDKQLRPIEALIQYRLFLHRLELERIEARGEAAAKLADAIARARERIIVLERRTGQ